MNIKQILSGLAMLLAVVGIIWPNTPCIAVGVILLGVINLIP